MDLDEQVKEYIERIMGTDYTTLEFNVTKDLSFDNMKGVITELSSISGPIFIGINYNNDFKSKDRTNTYLILQDSLISLSPYIQNDLIHIEIGGSFNIIFKTEPNKTQIAYLNEQINSYINKD